MISRLAQFTFEVAEVDTVYDTLSRHGIAVTEKELGVDHTWWAYCSTGAPRLE